MTESGTNRTSATLREFITREGGLIEGVTSEDMERLLRGMGDAPVRELALASLADLRQRVTADCADILQPGKVTDRLDSFLLEVMLEQGNPDQVERVLSAVPTTS